jgi:hypothetical protein
LIHELERFGRRDRPLRIFLAWQEHRKLALSTLEKEKSNLGLYGEIICLDSAGNVIAANKDRAEASSPEVDAETTRKSLTSLRQHMAQATQGRVLIGGRRSGFQGELPGVLEEALYALEAGQPLYLAGGFGGVTHDMACALGGGDGKWFPPQEPPVAADGRLVRGLERLVEAAKKTGFKSLDNGLSPQENQRLAACYRPSEIATLVSLGLGRRFDKRGGSA